jgi:hypothetical protein
MSIRMNKKENFSCGYYKDKQFFMQEETGSRSGKKFWILRKHLPWQED